MLLIVTMKFQKIWSILIFLKFWGSIHGNIVVPMIAKIIQNQYMAGTYIVLKYDDSEFKQF